MTEDFFNPLHDNDIATKGQLEVIIKSFNSLTRNLDPDNRNDPHNYRETVLVVAQWMDQLFKGPAPIEFVEKLLAHYKQRKQQIVGDYLPSLMHELGTSKITLESGETVELRTDVSVSCPKEHKPMLFAWLTQEGHQDEIKTKVEFNKGDFTEDVERRLDESGMPFTVTQDVHAQTLKRIFRERMEEGKPIPDASIAKVTTFEYAKVK